MGLFFFRFWPVLIPLAAYLLWLAMVRRSARKAGKPPVTFREGPWYWAVLASLLTALACFVVLGSFMKSDKGPYVPPHMANGQLVPGHVDNQP